MRRSGDANTCNRRPGAPTGTRVPAGTPAIANSLPDTGRDSALSTPPEVSRTRSSRRTACTPKGRYAGPQHRFQQLERDLLAHELCDAQDGQLDLVPRPNLRCVLRER